MSDDAIAEQSIRELTAELEEWQRVAAQRQEQIERTEKRFDEAIDLLVEVGGALDGAIASHLLPGVVGKNARQLSLKSRKWLAANAGAARAAAPAAEASPARNREVELLAGEALGLWAYWCRHDITNDNDHWAEFTNAVLDLLAGKPVPKRFIGQLPAHIDVAVPRVRTRLQELQLELDNLRANVKSLDLEEPLAQQKRLADATALLNSWMLSTPPLRGARPVQQTRDFLAATTSAPAEPAPSPLERLFGAIPDMPPEEPA